jgi:hypothetical protein
VSKEVRERGRKRTNTSSHYAVAATVVQATPTGALRLGSTCLNGSVEIRREERSAREKDRKTGKRRAWYETAQGKANDADDGERENDEAREK